MIDLAQLPAPAIVEALDFETLLAARKSAFLELMPDDQRADLAQVLSLESEPLTKLLEENVYRELLWRQRVNEAAKASLLAYAQKTDLDNRAADYGITRLLLSPADPDAVPPIEAVYESDDRLRYRCQMALEGLTVAGSRGAYHFHALSAHAQISDASIDSPTFEAVDVGAEVRAMLPAGAIVLTCSYAAGLVDPLPGDVTVAVLATSTATIPVDELVGTTQAALSADEVRPLTDRPPRAQRRAVRLPGQRRAGVRRRPGPHRGARQRQPASAGRDRGRSQARRPDAPIGAVRGPASARRAPRPARPAASRRRLRSAPLPELHRRDRYACPGMTLGTIPSLLPPSATRLERAAAAVSAPAIDAAPLRTLGDSSRIPAAFLPWLAWGSSTDGWQEALTEQARRALVRDSVAIHQRKGTAGAIRRVLDAIGASIDLAEWQQTGGAPYTFTLTVWAGNNPTAGDDGLINLELYARIRRMVDAVKNERSHYQLNVGARFDGGVRFGSAVTTTAIARAAVDALPVQPSPMSQPLRVATAARVVSIVRASMES
ncbi:phage tail protein I [Roseateles sp. UC29_93]|uniref:phage tail protein I n=1 Tax=Roseateles sp. UC29_93 TaxID=3350177 RepID=UPI00366BD23F